MGAAINSVAVAAFGHDGKQPDAVTPIAMNEDCVCAQAWVQTVWKSWKRYVDRARQSMEKLEVEVAKIRESEYFLHLCSKTVNL